MTPQLPIPRPDPDSDDELTNADTIHPYDQDRDQKSGELKPSGWYKKKNFYKDNGYNWDMAMVVPKKR